MKVETKEGSLHNYTEITTDPEQSAIRIDKFVVDRLSRVSRNRVQNAIRAGAILVDGEEVKPNFKISPNQKITVLLPKPIDSSTELLPEPMDLDIRYEDDDVMVIHKPPGLVVHPGVGNWKGTLVNGLAHYFKDRDLPSQMKGASDRPGLVHRIDKDTSGLLVIAKTDYAMTHLAKQFFKHTIERKYLAIVWGEPEPANDTIKANVGRHPRFRKEWTAFDFEGEEGKWAVTHYKTIEPLHYVSLIECQLETGRTHQIRVHMKHHGHPLFNDSTYGGDRIMKGTIFSKYRQFVENTFAVLPRQALHAQVLGFEHPTTGEHMRFVADLPEDMQNALTRWRDYVNSRREL